jgi:hypothetical protein
VIVSGDTDAAPRAELQAARYDPAEDAWTELPELAVAADSDLALAWTDADVVAIATNGATAEVWRWNPGNADAWEPARVGELPFQRHEMAPGVVFTGTELLLVGRAARDQAPTLFAFDVALERWRSVSASDLVGSGEAVWNGWAALFVDNTLAPQAYDPTLDRWLSLPARSDLQFDQPGATWLWASDRLLGWGGGSSESTPHLTRGIAFVPDAMYADAAVEGCCSAVRVEVVDESGSLVGARGATPEELSAIESGEFDGYVAPVVGDTRSVLVGWRGDPGQSGARLVVDEDGRELALDPVPDYGDLLPVVRGVVLTFAEDVDVAALDLTVRN